MNAPAPCDVTQFKSFIGLVNYYSTFLQTLWHHCTRLNISHGHWGKEQADAFQKAKSQLSSDVLLVHFDPGRKLAILCDVCPYGIGAVLTHVYEDGTDRSIASCTGVEFYLTRGGLARLGTYTDTGTCKLNRGVGNTANYMHCTHIYIEGT